jgi:exopolyphosphatase/guanosine-5'-triphosphate,3'-diphosphate pyrophosphatase
MLGFATSAVRDAVNSEAVLDHVRERTGVRIEVLPGEDEARLTFLAVRRWFGWSAGRLAVFDIGGGSLEIAGGGDEAPDVAWSLPLGAARLARSFADAALDEEELREVRRRIRADIARDAGHLLRAGPYDKAVATSKTFRSLARICGAAPSAEGPLVPRSLPLAELRRWIPKLLAMSRAELSRLPGVSAERAHQILPGALVAEACMEIFDLDALEICPWALREGVILERLDQMSFLGDQL